MALDRKARRMTLIAAVVLIAGAIAYFVDRRGSESPVPPGPFGTRVGQRAPVNPAGRDTPELSDLRLAVDRLGDTLSKEPLAETDWQEAEREAQDVMQIWVSFKPPMRANAGERMWSPSDVDEFEESVKEARTQVQERDAGKARMNVERMQRLIDKYDDGGGAMFDRDGGE